MDRRREVGPALHAEYDKTIRDMLQMPVELTESGEVNRRVLYLSLEAFGLHKRHYNEIQSELVRYGSLMPIKGLAEKAPEHACRPAATLAFASDPKVREIGAEHYNAAVALIGHYLSEALRLRYRKEPDDLRRRADDLHHWLKQQHAAGR